MKMQLAQCPLGRVLLHLMCLLCDGHIRWHWAGVAREFQRLVAALHHD